MHTSTNQAATHLAGIGASAGGLESMMKLLPKLSANGRIAYVIAQHMAKRDYDAVFHTRMKGQGIFAELIAKRFKLACQRLGLNAAREELDISKFQPPGDKATGGKNSLGFSKKFRRLSFLKSPKSWESQSTNPHVDCSWSTFADRLPKPV